jgi:hypothetical protein
MLEDDDIMKCFTRNWNIYQQDLQNGEEQEEEQNSFLKIHLPLHNRLSNIVVNYFL